MIIILLLFLMLIAGIVLGPFLAGNQGYVLIQTTHYNIETSVTGLVIILMILFISLRAVEWLIRRILSTRKGAQSWFTGRKRIRARKQTQAALIKLTERDYQQVEKLLAHHADHAEQPMVNYLLAAEAAQQRGDEFRTNQYLERAAEEAKDNQLPVDITRVRIQLAQGKIHAARHGVEKLLQVAPRHPEILRLAEQTFLQMSAWEALLSLLPLIEKIKLYDQDKLAALSLHAHLGLMRQIMAEEGSQGLQRWWYQQNVKVQQNILLQVTMIKHLIECGDHQTAQNILLQALKHHYDERLITLIPAIKSTTPEALEKILRTQIKKQGKVPILYSTLGKFLLKRGEWQKASEAFQVALSARQDQYDYSWLADALDKLNRTQEAANARHEALRLTLQSEEHLYPK